MNSCSRPFRRCRPEPIRCSGRLAVYVGEKIVLLLRDKREGTADNGIWLATTAEHHGWQVLPVDAADFEEAALQACDLFLAGEARIGKIPKERKGSGAARKRKGKLRGRLVE